MAIERLAPLDRIPPQSLEGEQAVLGSMLIERAAVEKAAEILRP
jgi:replicative DNA helicase